MRTTSFRVNTAMLCYNCQRAAAVRRMQSWRDVTPAGQESEVLDVVFVSCAACLTLPNVHKPGGCPKYLDPKKYSDTIKSLGYIFDCTPNISEETKFSVTALKFKKMTKIRNAMEIFSAVAAPDTNTIYLRFQAPTLGFFGNNGVDFQHSSSLFEDKKSFASVGPVFLQVPEFTPAFCHGCLSDLTELPKYEAETGRS